MRAGSGDNPPISTKIDDSKIMKNMASSFCRPWNVFLPSVLVRSIFKMPEPFSSCSTIEAVTIGPMPRLIMLPNSAPNMTEKNWNLSSWFCPSPNSGIIPRTKNITSTIKVHFNFSLKGRNFCEGPSTSGRLLIMAFQIDILNKAQTYCL